MNNVKVLVALIFSMSVANALASWERNLTPGELALMPDFCQDVQTVNGWEQGVRESPRAPYWVSKMGRSFWDMHHYCWAGIAVHRSKKPGLNQNQRDHLIETAIDDYYYVVRRAPPTMALMPELYYLIGDSQRQIRQYGAAIESFKMARSLKADYWPAYAGHADVLLLSNQKAEARAVLEQGLALMPNEAALKIRLDRLKSGASSAETSAAPAPVRATKNTNASRNVTAAAKPASAAP
jgi:tetratricopeptide (TPR) repeat protein